MIISVDVEPIGNECDSSIFMKEHPRRTDNKLQPLTPYIVEGDGFPLQLYLIRSYLQKNLNGQKRLYKYTVGRCISVAENAFGILAQWWRLYYGQLKAMFLQLVPLRKYEPPIKNAGNLYQSALLKLYKIQTENTPRLSGRNVRMRVLELRWRDVASRGNNPNVLIRALVACVLIVYASVNFPTSYYYGIRQRRLQKASPTGGVMTPLCQCQTARQ
ncbi:hypothetical protein J6590_008283 [Homalodisca vitripennis]|nr:hypothetical protein J6590_008283 [Homalodisca vitripennis]